MNMSLLNEKQLPSQTRRTTPVKALLALVLASITPLTLHGATEVAKPNILVILADDLGYGDLQCYNPERGKIPTPHLDRLAAEGMRFIDGHSSAGGCTPSRYALLTGRYDWRRFPAGVFGEYGGPALISPDRLTIAGLARQNGYRTACIGKWHIGWNWPIDKAQRPFMRAPYDGYSKEAYTAPTLTEEHRNAWREVFSKPIAGGPTTVGFDYFFGVDIPHGPPFCFIENDRTLGIPTEFLPVQNFDKMKLANLQGPALKGWKLDAVLPELQKRACSYISQAAGSKEPFLLYLPLTSPHVPQVPSQEWRGKSGLHIYADFVMQTDALVGSLMDALQKAGLEENTLVFFSSDNGYSPFELQEMISKGHYSSGPLRGFKACAQEGGHRVPFLVRWPAVVKPGSVSRQVVQQTDLLATLAEIFGLNLPDNAGEDSFSFLPILRGVDRPVREHSINHSGQLGFGIRKDDWKLISEFEKKEPLQLYNLAENLGEKQNLASQYPEKVAELKALMARLVADGRSTPGPKQSNDTKVRWLREGATP